MAQTHSQDQKGTLLILQDVSHPCVTFIVPVENLKLKNLGKFSEVRPLFKARVLT